MLDSINIILYSACVVSTMMVIWFCTDAIYEYAKYLGFKTFFYVEDFEKQRAITCDLSYPDYLSIYRPSFLSNLLACPFCLGFWFSFFIPYAMYAEAFDPKLFFPIYLLSLITFFLIKRISSE